LRRTLYLPVIIRGTEANAALDDAEAILDRAASRFGAEHLTVLVRRALTPAAYDISILILDAIACMRGGDEREQQQTANDDSAFHDLSHVEATFQSRHHLARLTISPTIAVNCCVISPCKNSLDIT